MHVSHFFPFWHSLSQQECLLLQLSSTGSSTMFEWHFFLSLFLMQQCPSYSRISSSFLVMDRSTETFEIRFVKFLLWETTIHKSIDLLNILVSETNNGILKLDNIRRNTIHYKHNEGRKCSDIDRKLTIDETYIATIGTNSIGKLQVIFIKLVHK